MALAESAAVDTAKTLLELRAGEQTRLALIGRYITGKHSSVYVPRSANNEYRWLMDIARVNMLRLVISVLAQNLYVDGYRRAKTDDNAAPWAAWQANRMDAMQHGVHRSALKYGVAYTLVLPGEPQPVITPMSPRRMTAFYADPVNDEWPIYALEVTTQQVKGDDGKLVRRRFVRLFDDSTAYEFEANEEFKKVEFKGSSVHDLGVCPVVRYLNEADLDEDECVAGEVEPLIALQDQVNSTTFNLLMAQQFAAFRQRWIAGMVTEDEEGRPIQPFRSRVDDVFIAEDPATKFGEFNATDLVPYLKSREESLRQMATVSQVPPYHLLGAMVNLSAEALAAARDGLDRKTDERKSTFGEAHEQTMRLAGLASGDKDAWADTESQVIWRDTSARALAATVDALGKLAQMLNVPVQELWEKIPGVTQGDVERWKSIAAEGDAVSQLTQLLDRQMGSTSTSAGPAVPEVDRVPAQPMAG